MALHLVGVVIGCERPPQREVQLWRGESVVVFVLRQVDTTPKAFYHLQRGQTEDIDSVLPDHAFLTGRPDLDRVDSVTRRSSSEMHTEAEPPGRFSATSPWADGSRGPSVSSAVRAWSGVIPSLNGPTP